MVMISAVGYQPWTTPQPLQSDSNGESIDNFRHAKPGADISVTRYVTAAAHMCHSTLIRC